jgi:hypothetical protein
MSYQKLKLAMQPTAAKLYKIPVLGYGARLAVAFVKLPRINHHLRRLDTQSIEYGSKLEGDLAPVRSSLSDVTGRLLRVEDHTRALDAHTKAFEGRLQNLEEAWRQHIPAFLNSVTSVGAFGHELAQQRKTLETSRQEFQDTNAKYSSSTLELWERLEFIRREIMFEMKYAMNNNTSEGKQRLEPRIVSSSKFEELSEKGLRLNLGCGHVLLEDYINVDMRDLPGVDIVTGVDDLPVAKNSVHEIFSSHVLEHFPQEELIRKLLPYWRDLLVPGGKFRAVVPDAATMVSQMAAEKYPFEEFREVFFGAQDYEGDFHFNMFTPASLTMLLEKAGFSDVEVVAAGRRNGKCFEFEIQALKAH